MGVADTDIGFTLLDKDKRLDIGEIGGEDDMDEPDFNSGGGSRDIVGVGLPDLDILIRMYYTDSFTLLYFILLYLFILFG